jgi:hypothetical protein
MGISKLNRDGATKVQALELVDNECSPEDSPPDFNLFSILGHLFAVEM